MIIDEKRGFAGEDVTVSVTYNGSGIELMYKDIGSDREHGSYMSLEEAKELRDELNAALKVALGL